MARYDYTCRQCGIFEAVCPMGAAAPIEDCPSCGRESRRVFSAPALTSPRSPVRRVREAADRSAHEPIVTGGPAALSRSPARPFNPLHARLPRP
jgi:putative FmdB family regulatory protein